MQEFLQTHSYVFISMGVVAGLMVALRALRVRWRYVLGTALILSLVLTVGLLILRPGVSDVDSVQAAEAMIHNGRPTFLEFFSNY